MQIKSAQTEHDQIGILLTEYLYDPIASTGNYKINQGYDAMWNLVNIIWLNKWIIFNNDVENVPKLGYIN